MTKKRLWARKLSCGHTRHTDIAYMMKKYDKPKVGESCFCRICNNNMIIEDVYEVKIKGKKQRRGNKK